MGIRVQRHTHTEQKEQIYQAKAHPIQYGAGLTDGPSVFKAEGATLISKQVKPKRRRERETPLCRHGIKVLPATPPQLGLTSNPHPCAGCAHLLYANIAISICLVLYVPQRRNLERRVILPSSK